MIVSCPRLSKSLKKKVPWLANSLPLLCIITAGACAELMSKRLLDKITVHIEFIHDPNSSYGFCEYIDDFYRPREFKLILNVGTIHNQVNLLLTAVHECFHVAQFATERLYQYAKRNRVMRWEGKAYSVVGLTSKQISKMPWEKEAYKGEEKLFLKLIDKLEKAFDGNKNLLAE